MLPLSLLKTAQGHPMLVELKNGDTYNGHLVNCDTWMNVNLREVICTSKDGDRFWKMPECYIRGNTIKYIRVPNEILDMVNEEDFNKRGKVSVLKTVKPTADVVVEAVAASETEEVVEVVGDVGDAEKEVADVAKEVVDVGEVEVAVVVVDVATTS
ncbi:LSM domain-containing protein [Phytophthora infestans]|uniref:U6 snRNA-associated Sm-like protein LSm4 n=1 Tax=Phytophthora infestans TaxID=4787 RepID=A0A8S9VF37_PHYIN|nr:LSM domain-containing protein [Phytophthora infestans]